MEGEGYSKRVVLAESQLGIPGSFLQEVRFKKGDKVLPHHHRTQTEVFYAVTRAFFVINGEEVVMEPGDIVICEPGDVHGNPVIPEDMIILVLKIDYANNDTVWERS
jgi:quercetin dioxygenase-like cupin family protein